MIPDQKVLWNKKHQANEHEDFRGIPSSLAQLLLPLLTPNSNILELGCGVARDAVFFAQNGHKVMATDFSDKAIENNRRRFPNAGVDFLILDMEKVLPFADKSFDVVFANLSLHYYNRSTTEKVTQEIARMLKTGGIFAFACKTVNDFHYGKGEEIENDLFISKTGHARHLFSTDYTKELLQALFKIELLEEVDEVHYGEKSAVLHCIAKKV